MVDCGMGCVAHAPASACAALQYLRRSDGRNRNAAKNLENRGLGDRAAKVGLHFLFESAAGLRRVWGENLENETGVVY